MQEWLRFLRAESDVLRENGSRLFQQAMNQPQTSAPARVALARFEAGRETRPWFRWINKPDRLEPEILRLSGHVGQVLRCAYVADRHQLVSLSQRLRHYADESDDNQPTELVWWNAATGAMVSTHPLDVELITASAFNDDARLLALAIEPFRQRSKDPRLSDPGVLRSIKLIDTATGSLITVLPGCDQQIPSCSFSLDGTRLVTGDWAGTVRVWDVRSHREIFTISAHEKTIRVCAFAPSGNLIVTADTVNLKFWDANSGEHLRTTELRPVAACVFLSDQQLAVTTNELSIIDVTNGEILVSESAGGSLLAVLGSSPDLPILATGLGGPTLRLWHSAALASIGSLRGHEEAITSVAFLQTERQIASSAKDGTVRIWELPRINELATLDTHNEVRRVSFLGNTNHIVAGGDDKFIRIWNGESAEELLEIPVGRGISALACSIDSQHVAAGMWWYENSSQQGFLAVWRIEETTATKVAEVDVGCTNCAYSSDGKYLAAVNEWTNLVTIFTGQELEEVAKLSEDGWRPKVCTFARNNELLIVVGDDFVNRLELRFFRTADWKQLRRLKTGQWRATDCAVSPDGNLVAATSQSSGLATVDMKTGKVTKIDCGRLTSCAFSPDSTRLVCGTEDKTLEIWNLADSKKVGILAGHSASVSDCEWSHDGRLVVSSSQDGSAKLWDPAVVAESSGTAEMRGPVSECRYSADSKFVLARGSGDPDLKLWDSETGALVSKLPSQVGTSHFAYTSEPGYVLTGDDQGGLKLFSFEGAVLSKVEGDRDPINSIALAPGGERLAVAAGRLRDIKIYDSHTLALVSVIPSSQPDEPFSRPAFSADGSTLIICTNKRLLFYEVISGHLRYDVSHATSAGGRGENKSWAISPDGALLALMRKRPAKNADATTVAILSLKEEREIVSFDVDEQDDVRCFFSPEGWYFAIATQSTLRTWDIRAGTELQLVTEEDLSDSRYSADGQRLLIVAGERMRVFNAATLNQEAEFVVNQSIGSFDVSVDGRHFALGGVGGNLLLLDAMGFESHAPVMTGVSFYNFETQKWNKEPAVKCPWCGIVVHVSADVLEAIRGIEHAASLSPTDVPCFSLPKEAWSNPRLLSNCLACRKQLRFNPFLNDFQNRLPRPTGGPASVIRNLWRNSR